MVGWQVIFLTLTFYIGSPILAKKIPKQNWQLFWDILKIRSLFLIESNSHFLLSLPFFPQDFPPPTSSSQRDFSRANWISQKHTYVSIAPILFLGGGNFTEGRKRRSNTPKKLQGQDKKSGLVSSCLWVEQVQNLWEIDDISHIFASVIFVFFFCLLQECTWVGLNIKVV